MKDDSSYITLEIEDPLGQTREITVPATANVQQFVDSLVSLLNLPVIDSNEDGIIYALQKADNEVNLAFNEQLNTFGLIDSDHLRLVPGTQLSDQADRLNGGARTTQNSSMYITVVAAHEGNRSRRIGIEPNDKIQRLIQLAEQRLRLRKRGRNGRKISYVLLNNNGEPIDSSSLIRHSGLTDGQEVRLTTARVAKRMEQAKFRRENRQNRSESRSSRAVSRPRKRLGFIELFALLAMLVVIGVVIANFVEEVDSQIAPIDGTSIGCLLALGIFGLAVGLLFRN